MKLFAIGLVAIICATTLADAPRDTPELNGNKLRAALKQVTEERDALAAKVDKLERELWTLKHPGQPFPATQPATANDEIQKAIDEHRLVKGMNETQAERAAGKPTSREDGEPGKRLWTWQIIKIRNMAPGRLDKPKYKSEVIRVVIATFVDGKITSVTDEKP